MTGWLEHNRRNREEVMQREAEEAERRRLEVEQLTNPPSGYRRALLSDQLVPLVCEQCGASVADSAAGLHDEWHASAS